MITFTINSIEEETFKKWRKKLPKPKKKIGFSNIWFKFTPTGIGVKVDVGRNDIPKFDKDITDYDSW